MGRHVAKRSVKLQLRDLVRVVGIVAPFAPWGSRYPGKFVVSRPSGLMGTGDLCRVPPAVVCHGRARQISGTEPCGYCRRILWVPDSRGQLSWKYRFIEKPEVQDEGSRHVAKRMTPGSLPQR